MSDAHSEARSVLQSIARACSAGKRRWAQRALDGEPQYVSRQGKDAVVIVSYDAIAKAVRPPENLFDFLQSSPLADADLDIERMAGDFRDVNL